MTAFGIDFGTTSSLVATYANGTVDVLDLDTPPPEIRGLGLERVLPSVLGVVGGDTVTCGWAAKTQATDKLEAVKRLFATEEMVDIGGHRVSVELAAATLFGHIRSRTAQSGAPISKAVVTIPANSRGLARYRTKVCAGLAGIAVPVLINEPTAAAMAQSISARDDQTILVFDWGGGTLDVTVLGTVANVFMERASKGIPHMGGIDLDEAFADALLSHVTGSDAWTGADRTRFRMRVERAKIELSTKDETNIELPGGGFHVATRADLEQAIRAMVEKTRNPIEQCLCDLQINAGAIDHVVLVGGSSRIPMVRQFVSEVLGKEPTGTVDPLTAVAEGAAIAAAILDDQIDADFFVSTEHALGTFAVNSMTQQRELSVIIPRNRALPATETLPYTPVRDNQEAVEVEVVEGDPEVPVDDPDNVVLKQWSVPIDKARPKEESVIDVRFSYDTNGLLEVAVFDRKTGQELLRDDVGLGVTKDKAGLVRTAQQVRETLESGLLSGRTSDQHVKKDEMAKPAIQVDPQAAALVSRIRTKIVPFVDQAEAKRLESLCLDHEMSGGTSRDCAEALERECQQYSYLLT